MLSLKVRQLKCCVHCAMCHHVGHKQYFIGRTDKLQSVLLLSMNIFNVITCKRNNTFLATLHFGKGRMWRDTVVLVESEHTEAKVRWWGWVGGYGGGWQTHQRDKNREMKEGRGPAAASGNFNRRWDHREPALTSPVLTHGIALHPLHRAVKWAVRLANTLLHASINLTSSFLPSYLEF